VAEWDRGKNGSFRRERGDENTKHYRLLAPEKVVEKWGEYEPNPQGRRLKPPTSAKERGGALWRGDKRKVPRGGAWEFF